MKNNNHTLKKGQTLIILLIFILVAITVATTSVSVIISNAQSTTGAGLSMEAYYAAEAGIENATLQLLRNPNYTGETLQVSTNSTAEITVDNSSGFIVTSVGKTGGYSREIRANLDYTNNVLTVTSWTEIYP